MDRSYIAGLIQELDTPDTEAQRLAMDNLVLESSDAVDTIVASLGFSTPRVKSALIQVLEEIGDQQALLPLMRYVWDSRQKVEESSPRALAMRAIVQISSPLDAPRLFNFMMDLVQDDDRFVRGWVAESFGRFGDPRAEPILKELLRDKDEHVRERAEIALNRLKGSDLRSLDQDLSADELLGRIRQARGGQQDYYIGILKERDDALELSARLVREGGRGVIQGLYVLREINDPRARLVAGRVLEREPNSDHRAIALAILAQHLKADADAAEIELIRANIFDSDPFVRVSSLECAALSGDLDLVQRAVESLFVRDTEALLSSARGLSRGLTAQMRSLFPRLSEAFDVVHRRRLAESDDRLVRAEAYLVRAISRLVVPGSLGLTQAREIALRALFDASEHKPLAVTGLELLESSTPDPLSADIRFSVEHTRSLGLLLDVPSREVRDRALKMLWYGAAKNTDSLVPALERILFDQDADLECVIRVLEAIDSKRSRSVLEEIVKSDSTLATAAQAALNRLRGQDDWIDAEFDADEF